MDKIMDETIKFKIVYFCGNVSEFMEANISATRQEFVNEFSSELIKVFLRDEKNQIEYKGFNEIEYKQFKEIECAFKIVTAFLNVIKNKKKAGKNAKVITTEIPSITYGETRYILNEMGYGRKQTEPSLFIHLPDYEPIVRRVCKSSNLNFFDFY